MLVVLTSHLLYDPFSETFAINNSFHSELGDLGYERNVIRR